MTIGYQMSDMRLPYTYEGSTTLYGSYFQREWAGADQIDRNIPYQEHPYQCDVFQFESFKCDFHHPDGHTYIIVPAPDPPDFALVTWTSNDEILLINKLGNKIRGSDFNLGNFLGEHRQTLSLVTGTATRVAKMLHYLRNGNLYEAAKSVGAPQLASGHILKRLIKPGQKLRDPKLVSDAILEYQYGWKPLLSDVHSSMATMAERTAVPFKHTFKVRRQIVNGKLIDTGSCTAKHHVTHGVALKVTMSTPPSLTTTLNLDNPLGVLWEVTPWSFVADWFIPIGGYLDAVNVIRSFSFDSIVRSDRVKGSTILIPTPGIPNYWGNLSGTYKRTVLHRTTEPLSFGALAPPAMKGFSKAFSAEHTLNALALLTSTTDGFRKQLKF